MYIICCNFNFINFMLSKKSFIVLVQKFTRFKIAKRCTYIIEHNIQCVLVFYSDKNTSHSIVMQQIEN